MALILASAYYLITRSPKSLYYHATGILYFYAWLLPPKTYRLKRSTAKRFSQRHDGEVSAGHVLHGLRPNLSSSIPLIL